VFDRQNSWNSPPNNQRSNDPHDSFKCATMENSLAVRSQSIKEWWTFIGSIETKAKYDGG